MNNPMVSVVSVIGGAGMTALNNIGLITPILIFLHYRYEEILSPESRPINIPTEHLLDEYDFIIVGGGSAGAVVANRLSEVENWKVLLLEAGGDENGISDVPLLAIFLQSSSLDWNYKTEPQGTACLAMNEGRCNWPRGKVIGGSSVLNLMLYLRGHKNDYDDWAAMGNTGWDYNNVLHYFKKSEDNTNPNFATSPYHSTGGYLTVGESPFRTPLADAFVQAGIEMGYNNTDLNSENGTGIMIAQGTVRNGNRCSSAKAFLRPIRLRSNLHIAMHSHVTRLMIDPISKRAFGVEFVRNRKIHHIRASKEVIVSAGSINSPQLLMLSGIGPRDELAKHKIPLIKELPVGENLHDHIGLGGLTFSLNSGISFLRKRIESFSTILEYALYGQGPLTSFSSIEAIAHVKTKYANASDDVPDVQLNFVSSSTNSDDQLRKAHGLTQKFYDTVYKPYENEDTWSIVPLLLRPKSTGSIRLKSRNPFDYPYIYPNYFFDNDDMKTLVEGVKMAVAFSQTHSMQRFGSKLIAYNWPGCDNIEIFSDDFWECMIRHCSYTIYHPVSTCKMGPHWDSTAVVDPDLRVNGIKGLRVIDASIMPKLVGGNINAPVIMIGEKGADMVKNYWLHQNRL